MYSKRQTKGGTECCSSLKDFGVGEWWEDERERRRNSYYCCHLSMGMCESKETISLVIDCYSTPLSLTAIQSASAPSAAFYRQEKILSLCFVFTRFLLSTTILTHKVKETYLFNSCIGNRSNQYHYLSQYLNYIDLQ